MQLPHEKRVTLPLVPQTSLIPRGNSYSRNHTSLDPCTSCADFWRFGFEESALNDYPVFVDFILEATGSEDLFFVGYSMGTTQYLIMLAELPEYNDKFRAGFLLGPTAFGARATNPLVSLSDLAEDIKYLLELMGIHEFLPNFLEVKSWLSHIICKLTNVHSEVCRNLFSLFVGMTPAKLNLTMVPTYMSHMPAGSSVTQFVHYAQLFRNGGRFTRFDHGRAGNLLRYGAAEPPEYRLDRVTAATALLGGTIDGFAVPEDVEELAGHLPNVFWKEEVDGFSHLDFLWSVDAKELVYDKIVSAMEHLQ